MGRGRRGGSYQAGLAHRAPEPLLSELSGTALESEARGLDAQGGWAPELYHVTMTLLLPVWDPGGHRLDVGILQSASEGRLRGH